MGQASLFVDLGFAFESERYGHGAIVDLEARGPQLDTSGGVARVGRFARNDPPGNADHRLEGQTLGRPVRLRMIRRIEHPLQQATRVPQLHEDQLSQVASPVDPAGDHDLPFRRGIRIGNLPAANRAPEQPLMFVGHARCSFTCAGIAASLTVTCSPVRKSLRP